MLVMPIKIISLLNHSIAMIECKEVCILNINRGLTMQKHRKRIQCWDFLIEKKFQKYQTSFDIVLLNSEFHLRSAQCEAAASSCGTEIIVLQGGNYCFWIEAAVENLDKRSISCPFNVGFCVCPAQQNLLHVWHTVFWSLSKSAGVDLGLDSIGSHKIDCLQGIPLSKKTF